MLGPADETVGLQFRTDLLQVARDKTLAVINEVAGLIRPGLTENDVKVLIQDIQTKLGAERTWHAPQVRFGENSVLGFGKKGLDNPALKAEDIYFIDIGPVFDAHEGDVGRSFAVGGNPEQVKCCQDVEAIWFEVRDHWLKTGCTGLELYRFASEAASRRGWQLSLEKANGHRIADFPHAAKARGSIEGFESSPMPNRWILEIQIRHPSKPWGAFYEDILN